METYHFICQSDGWVLKKAKYKGIPERVFFKTKRNLALAQSVDFCIDQHTETGEDVELIIHKKLGAFHQRRIYSKTKTS